MWKERKKEKKKNETHLPEWGALCYHGNSSDVRAGIMWLLIESVEERANKTGTITHTQGDGGSSCYTHAHTNAYSRHINKSICTLVEQTHSHSSTLNKKQTGDKVCEYFYNPDSGKSSHFYKGSWFGMQDVQIQRLPNNLGTWDRGNSLNLDISHCWNFNN